MADAGFQASEERAKSKDVRALRALWPFVLPYRILLFASVLALVMTAVLSLILPLAVRRVVDGFETSAVFLLDQYFTAALGIALLAHVAGMFVERWLFFAEAKHVVTLYYEGAA